ncbi:MAG TPA: cupin domain-containing protein, partial [Anaerolineae bacterium]|nr:cupin domain-containing protein [Anaerolineae bacterium]
MSEKLFFPNWRENVVYGEKGPQLQVLSDNGRTKVLVSGLGAGARIASHPEGEGVYYILEGRGWMIVDEERFPVEAGAIVIVPDGSSRGLEAETPLAFLA